jgi:hypothetical protein
VNLQATLARVSTVMLLLLAASPYTAPYAVCDIADHADHRHAPADRHLSHASAVVRPPAKIARQPIVLSLRVTRDVSPRHRIDRRRLAIACQPPAPERYLVLRV